MENYLVSPMLAPSGDAWFSKAWSNGIPRDFTKDPVDPYDSRFLTGRLPSKLSIDGKGTATIYDNTRIFVSGSWLNTETTIYVFVPSSTSGVISIRSRSNHETKCGFGDYVTIYELAGTEGECKTRKEPIHPIYIGNVSIKSYTFPLDKWVGLKSICRNVGNDKVLSQGYIDYGDHRWVKMTEYIDEGDWPGCPDTDTDLWDKAKDCVGKEDNIPENMRKPFMGRGKHCWVRCDVKGIIKLNYFSLIEITPVEFSSA